VEIIHATGIEGAREARGIAVVIDVLRSFTVSAYALAGGARECRLVTTTDEARALAASGRVAPARVGEVVVCVVTSQLYARASRAPFFSRTAPQRPPLVLLGEGRAEKQVDDRRGLTCSSD